MFTTLSNVSQQNRTTNPRAIKDGDASLQETQKKKVVHQQSVQAPTTSYSRNPRSIYGAVTRVRFFGYEIFYLNLLLPAFTFLLPRPTMQSALTFFELYSHTKSQISPQIPSLPSQTKKKGFHAKITFNLHSDDPETRI